MTSPETEFVSILDAPENSATSPPRISSRSLPETLPILGLSDIVIFPGGHRAAARRDRPEPEAHGRRGGRRPSDWRGAATQTRSGRAAAGGFARRRLRVAAGQNGEISRRHRAHAGRGTVAHSHQGILARRRRICAPPTNCCATRRRIRSKLQAMLRNAHKQFEEIAKLSAALSDQVKIAALNTDASRPFRRPHRRQPEPRASNDRQKLLETISVRERLQKLLPMLNREHEVLTLSSKIQSDVASSIAKTQRDFFLREQMRAIQRELGEADPSASEIKSLARKNRADADARRGAQGRDAGTGTAPADAARRRRIRRRAQLPRLDFEPAVGKGDRGQAGFEGGRADSERTAFRPGQKSRTGCWNLSPSSSAGNRSKARFFVWSARPASAKPRSARAWPTRWAASSRASRSAACGTRPRFAAIGAPTSAPCPDASSRPCAASKAATR